MDKVTLYQKALETWGADSQLMMAIEEMAELTKALAKAYRHRTTTEIVDAILEEIADVEIMMGQMRVMFDGQGSTTVDEVKEKKLTRLESMLGEVRRG